jgi:hypothetical protein
MIEDHSRPLILSKDSQVTFIGGGMAIKSPRPDWVISGKWQQ